jgi:hypothetical protein
MATRKPQAAKSPARTGKATAPTQAKATASKNKAPSKDQPEAKHPGGRPVKWTPEAIAEEGRALLAWMRADPTANWWFEDFAILRGYHPQRFSEWEAENEEFSEAVKTARAMQKSKVVKQGMEMRNPTMAIFILKNNHGMADKVDLAADVSVKKSVRELSEGELDALIMERMGGAGKKK